MTSNIVVCTWRPLYFFAVIGLSDGIFHAYCRIFMLLRMMVACEWKKALDEKPEVHYEQQKPHIVAADDRILKCDLGQRVRVHHECACDATN